METTLFLRLPSVSPLRSSRRLAQIPYLPFRSSRRLAQIPNVPFRSSSRFLVRRSSSSFTSQAIDATDPIVSDGPAVEEGASTKEEFDWYSQWYALAPVCDLDKRRPHAKTVMGIDVVVWWDRNEGRWQVLDDRCSHRLAPLSEGRIDRWGRLQCVYHGWCFDGKGTCKFIPQEPPDGRQFHASKKACVASYPSIEQNKILWFWPSSDPKYKDISEQKKPPYMPEIDDPSYASLMGNRDIPYGYEVLVENLMDPSHVPYAHHGIMRRPPQDKSKFRDREGGMPTDLKVLKLDKDGFFARMSTGFAKFMAPCVFYAYSERLASKKTDSSENTGEDLPVDPKKSRRFLLIFICIPVAPGRSRLIWCFPRNVAVWMDKIIPRWIFHVGQNLILDSDLYLLHLEEKKIAESGPSNWMKACFVPTTADALVVGFRRWIKKYANSQIDWRNKFQPVLPPTPPREVLLDRYRSHVVNCTSCSRALESLKVVQVALQVASLLSFGIVAVKQNALSVLWRSTVVSTAVLFFLASKLLANFIYKNFYYHDYDHAFK